MPTVPINVSGAGTTTLIPAVTNKKIIITSIFFMGNGTSTVQFLDSNGGGLLTGGFATNGGGGVFVNKDSDLKTQAGSAVQLSNGSAVSLLGHIEFIYA